MAAHDSDTPPPNDPSANESRNRQLREISALARRIAARWTRSAADADDLAQEAIVRYLTAAVPPENPPTWFYVVIRRSSHRRALRSAARANAEAVFSELRMTATRTSDLALEVAELLARVNERERRIITLLMAGAQSAEIADAFGCHVRDVGQMVSRARKRARRITGR